MVIGHSDSCVWAWEQSDGGVAHCHYLVQNFTACVLSACSYDVSDVI